LADAHFLRQLYTRDGDGNTCLELAKSEATRELIHKYREKQRKFLAAITGGKDTKMAPTAESKRRELEALLAKSVTKGGGKECPF